jgi:hypothetical protein
MCSHDDEQQKEQEQERMLLLFAGVSLVAEAKEI